MEIMRLHNPTAIKPSKQPMKNFKLISDVETTELSLFQPVCKIYLVNLFTTIKAPAIIPTTNTAMYVNAVIFFL